MLNKIFTTLHFYINFLFSLNFSWLIRVLYSNFGAISCVNTFFVARVWKSSYLNALLRVNYIYDIVYDNRLNSFIINIFFSLTIIIPGRLIESGFIFNFTTEFKLNQHEKEVVSLLNYWSPYFWYGTVFFGRGNNYEIYEKPWLGNLGYSCPDHH